MGMRDRIVGFNLMGKSSVESEASRIFGLSADLRGQEVFEVYFHCFFSWCFPPMLSLVSFSCVGNFVFVVSGWGRVSVIHILFYFILLFFLTLFFF